MQANTALGVRADKDINMGPDDGASELLFKPSSLSTTRQRVRSGAVPPQFLPMLLALTTGPLTSPFAVMTATKNAESLPYGPGPIVGDVAFFCTDCVDTPSDSWTETVACDGSNVDMTLVFKFDSAMSVVDRMRQCAATGCNVAFTVSGPGIITTSFNSDWWFTDVAVLPSTSGSGMSPDDGMWGGGPGMVNGNGQCYGDSNTVTSGFYGFGNCNAADSTTNTVHFGPNGSQQCPSLRAQLYATPPPSPPPLSPPPPSPSPPLPTSPPPTPPPPTPPPPTPPPPTPPPPTPPPPYAFRSTAALKTAAQAYNANPTAAIATYGPIADWDVSAITDMSGLFKDSKDFNADVSSWDTSSVTTMNEMFRSASAFNQPLSFDTSKVTDMGYMFAVVRSARALAPTALSRAFPVRAACVGTTQRPHASRAVPPSPASHARLSTRQGAFGPPFQAFNQPLSFDTSKVTNMGYMFHVRSARALDPHSLESGPPRACRLRRRHPQRPHASRAAPLPTPHARLSTRQGAFAFNQPLSFDTSKVTSMGGMFAVRSARALAPTALSRALPVHAACVAATQRPHAPGPYRFPRRMPASRLGSMRRRSTSRSASTPPASRTCTICSTMRRRSTSR